MTVPSQPVPAGERLEEQTAEHVIRVVVLYPDVMNVYADRGNLIGLRDRARVHGVGCQVMAIGIGDALPAEADLVLIGGGQDQEQRRIAADLAARGALLREWAESDSAMLAVCGGFQLFGHSYRTVDGEELPGVGIFDVTTVAPGPGWERCIGDVVAEAHAEDIGELVGFENHGGRSYLGTAAAAFAQVRIGYGNNGDDGTEGAVYRHAIGTYLHGSLLPKNPALTDRLIGDALRHRYGSGSDLAPLGDPWAERAYAAAVAVARRRGRVRDA